jgi:hypothetical protein
VSERLGEIKTTGNSEQNSCQAIGKTTLLCHKESPEQ